MGGRALRRGRRPRKTLVTGLRRRPGRHRHPRPGRRHRRRPKRVRAGGWRRPPRLTRHRTTRHRRRPRHVRPGWRRPPRLTRHSATRHLRRPGPRGRLPGPAGTLHPPSLRGLRRPGLVTTGITGQDPGRGGTGRDAFRNLERRAATGPVCRRRHRAAGLNLRRPARRRRRGRRSREHRRGRRSREHRRGRRSRGRRRCRRKRPRRSEGRPTSRTGLRRGRGSGATGPGGAGRRPAGRSRIRTGRRQTGQSGQPALHRTTRHGTTRGRTARHRTIRHRAARQRATRRGPLLAGWRRGGRTSRRQQPGRLGEPGGGQHLGGGLTGTTRQRLPTGRALVQAVVRAETTPVGLDHGPRGTRQHAFRFDVSVGRRHWSRPPSPAVRIPDGTAGRTGSTARAPVHPSGGIGERALRRSVNLFQRGLGCAARHWPTAPPPLARRQVEKGSVGRDRDFPTIGSEPPGGRVCKRGIHSRCLSVFSP
jgi:hypothetical protein